MAVRCVECKVLDHPLRVVPMSYCEHRVCVFSAECRAAHIAVCQVIRESCGLPPADTEPVQMTLFGEVA